MVEARFRPGYYQCSECGVELHVHDSRVKHDRTCSRHPANAPRYYPVAEQDRHQRDAGSTNLYEAPPMPPIEDHFGDRDDYGVKR